MRTNKTKNKLKVSDSKTYRLKNGERTKNDGKSSRNHPRKCYGSVTEELRLDFSSGKRRNKAKEKERFPINGRKRKKGIYKKVFRLDNIWTIQNCHKQKKEKKPQLEVVLSLWLLTKILCVDNFFRPHTKQKTEKEKGLPYFLLSFILYSVFKEFLIWESCF